jgi:hypothetical protein
MHKDGNPEAASSEHALDELAKGLANRSITRRQAFKLFSGALLGGVLASIPGVAALAQGGGGNSDAAHFCNQLPAGADRGKCVSDATQGQGLFVECGGDITRLCGTVCCGANEACTNGQCTCGGGPACTGGKVCPDNNGCPTGTHSCPGGCCAPMGGGCGSP